MSFVFREQCRQGQSAGWARIWYLAHPESEGRLEFSSSFWIRKLRGNAGRGVKTESPESWVSLCLLYFIWPKIGTACIHRSVCLSYLLLSFQLLWKFFFVGELRQRTISTMDKEYTMDGLLAEIDRLSLRGITDAIDNCYQSPYTPEAI